MLKLRRFFIVVCQLGLVATSWVHLAPSATAQSTSATGVFTWREAALTLEYPADWLVGEYAGHGFIASTADAWAKANRGQAPGAPFLAFLFYPQAKNLSTSALLDVIFPGVEGIDYQLALAKGIRAQFTDEMSAQTFSVISFESPATRTRQLLVAGAKADQWAAFAPILETILASVRFLRTTAQLEVFGARTTFKYSDGWVQQSSSQILVVAPDADSATAIVNGNLKIVTPFIRAQLLIPSSAGIDPASATAARDLLLLVLGRPADEIEVLQDFMWAAGMPATSAWFELEGLQLVMIAVITPEDRALIIGGGAPVAIWGQSQAAILGALNLADFNTVPPVKNLTAIITGQVVSGDVEIIGRAGE